MLVAIAAIPNQCLIGETNHAKLSNRNKGLVKEVILQTLTCLLKLRGPNKTHVDAALKFVDHCFALD